ncbi:MAG: PRC-barrel domain-containing protein, partial [Ruminiclostridium sp.]
MALKEGRSKARWNIFRDAEMEFQFMRSMAVMSEEGAEIGECLNVKMDAKDGNIEYLSKSWAKLAFSLKSDGVQQLEVNNVRSARSSYLRASNYY